MCIVVTRRAANGAAPIGGEARCTEPLARIVTAQLVTSVQGVALRGVTA
jgi:hypothetical protein